MTKTTEKPANKESKRDRVLGDEWDDWSGNLDESVTFNETSWLFAVYAVAAIFVVVASVGFILYMIEPRLFLIHPSLVFIVRGATAGAIAITAGWLILLILSALTGKNMIFGRWMAQVPATKILPITIAVARRLGVSRDRIGNSFVRFSNQIVRATFKPGKGCTIILLPRCLTPEIRKEVAALGERAGVKTFTAGGGGQARKIIKEQRPSAVIAVACERDLMSGISDVAAKIATLGITNKRPEGPCKNTTVDMQEIKNAIHAFTGVTLD